MSALSRAEGLKGISAASTGEKMEISPEIEKLTEEILRETERMSAQSPKSDRANIRKRKKSSPVKRLLIAVFLTALSAAVVFVAVKAVSIMNAFNSINYVTPSNRTSNTDLYVNRSVVQANVSHSDETKNILLLGCDVDEYGVSRSDSLIILSLDHEHKKIKMTSLMRDMYVQIPNYGKHKINASYVYGGGDLVLDTIYSNFGLNIDNYICVDYTLFAEIVDYIGGIDVYIEKFELEQFNKYVNGEDNQIQEAGTYHFNGQQALSYCRIRKVGTDTARTARQREVLNKIIDKCSKMSFGKLEKMLGVIAPKLTTNFTQSEMLGLMAEGFVSLDYDTDQMRIPADGTWRGEYIGEIWYLVFEQEQNAQYLTDFIYGDDEISTALSHQLQENDASAEQELREDVEEEY